LMNPPFALKTDPEYKFVQHALEQMEDGGILFAVLPLSVMIESKKATLTWRKEQLLAGNTLLAVITFPEDLFYPIPTHTLGIFVKKGIPHKEEQNVLWIRALHDGYVKKKGKRLRNELEKNDLEQVKNLLKGFIMDINQQVENIPEFQKACPINFKDKHLELVPEVYLDDKIPLQEDIEISMDNLMRETVSFLMRTKEKQNANI